MTRRRWRLSARIAAALKQAAVEHHLDVAEHLLRALEVLDDDAPPARDRNLYLGLIPGGRTQH